MTSKYERLKSELRARPSKQAAEDIRFLRRKIDQIDFIIDEQVDNLRRALVDDLTDLIVDMSPDSEE